MLQEFLYQVPWRVNDNITGNHPSLRIGTGLEFHSHSPLLAYPDIRHIDLHTSLRDPFGQYQVRRFQQPSSLTVVTLADMSASLNSFNKPALLREISQIIAWSSYRNGDRFSFLAGAEQMVPHLYVPPTRQYASLDTLWQQLQAYTPRGQHIHALLECQNLLPQQRSLIFLLSDFYFPLAVLERLFTALAPHDVIPMVLWHEKEYQQLPLWRFMRLRDPETNKVRHIFVRPRLQQALQQHFSAQRQALIQCCQRHGRRAFFVGATFQAERLSEYFLGADSC